MNFVYFVYFPSYGYFVLSSKPLNGHDKTKYTHPYKYTKYTKYTGVKAVSKTLPLSISKLINCIPIIPLFDVLVYLCELYKALSVFLCYVVKIQQLNFVYFCVLQKHEVHASTRGKGV